MARRLQTLGFTLDEVIDALHSTDRGDVSCVSERWRLEKVLDRIDDRIAELLNGDLGGEGRVEALGVVAAVLWTESVDEQRRRHVDL